MNSTCILPVHFAPLGNLKLPVKWFVNGNEETSSLKWMSTPNEWMTFSPSFLIQAEKYKWHSSSEAPNIDASNTYLSQEKTFAGDAANYQPPTENQERIGERSQLHVFKPKSARHKAPIKSNNCADGVSLENTVTDWGRKRGRQITEQERKQMDVCVGRVSPRQNVLVMTKYISAQNVHHPHKWYFLFLVTEILTFREKEQFDANLYKLTVEMRHKSSIPT